MAQPSDSATPTQRVPFRARLRANATGAGIAFICFAFSVRMMGDKRLHEAELAKTASELASARAENTALRAEADDLRRALPNRRAADKAAPATSKTLF